MARVVVVSVAATAMAAPLAVTLAVVVVAPVQAALVALTARVVGAAAQVAQAAIAEHACRCRSRQLCCGSLQRALAMKSSMF